MKPSIRETKMAKNNGRAFSDIVKEQASHTYTENGAKAKNTSSDALVDLFATIGALRGGNKVLPVTQIGRLQVMMDEAIKEDKLLVAKILFYARDVREGLGERDIFREACKYAATAYPEIIKDNIPYIGAFGRFDDLYAFVGTPLEADMWDYMKQVFEADLTAFHKGEPISLLAKWIKSADASSPVTKALGIVTAKNLGYSIYDFKRLVKKLRKEIGIVESKMSAKDWESINYAQVPSRAMLQYRNAFEKHDEAGFSKYMEDVTSGKSEIKATGIYPYDIVEKVLSGRENSSVLEAQWKALPDFIGKDINALVMADTSGSMYGRPCASALGLAMYFAERNTGAFHNLFMTFSNNPNFVTIKGNSLSNKINGMSHAEWNNNTDLEAAFMKILDLAVENNLKADEMVKSLVVISDMEIDRGEHSGWSFYEGMRKRFAAAGYEIPNVVFWNVNSHNDIFHADSKRKGVQLVSGQSVATFTNVINSIGMTPFEAMMEVLNRDRYRCIQLTDERELIKEKERIAKPVEPEMEL